MQPLSKQNPVAVDSAATGRVASPDALGLAAAGTERAAWFWSELARLRRRWDPIRHPFHRRWSAGQLSRGQLASYAEEYQLLVGAVAQLSRRAAERADGLLAFTLEEHALEQHLHERRWRAFARGIGWSPELSWYYGADPSEATLQCVRTWLGDPGRPLAHDLLTLYAVQQPQAELAALRLAALVRYYGVDAGPATEYFRLQLDADHPQAEVARAAIEQSFTETDPFALLRQAEAVYRAYWHVLEATEEDDDQ